MINQNKICMQSCTKTISYLGFPKAISPKTFWYSFVLQNYMVWVVHKKFMKAVQTDIISLCILIQSYSNYFERKKVLFKIKYKNVTI